MFNSYINIKLNTLLNFCESHKLSRVVESELKKLKSSVLDLEETMRLKFSGVGNYTHGEEFEIQNDIGLLWRSELRNGGWYDSGFDFVPWSGNATLELAQGFNLDLNFYRGKIQNISIQK